MRSASLNEMILYVIGDEALSIPDIAERMGVPVERIAPRISDMRKTGHLRVVGTVGEGRSECSVYRREGMGGRALAEVLGMLPPARLPRGRVVHGYASLAREREGARFEE